MTQTLTPLSNAEAMLARLPFVLAEASLTETTRTEVRTLAGQQAPAFGALVRFETARLATDPRGASWAKRLVTYTLPEDAETVLLRMLGEGRTVFTVEAVKGALGGTTRR
jgi:hypothetical protein